MSWEIELGGEVGIASIAILICVYLFIAICHLHLSGQSALLVVSLDIACFRLRSVMNFDVQLAEELEQLRA